MTAALLELADRVAALTARDRGIDAEIDCLIRFPSLRPARPNDHSEYTHGISRCPGDIWCPTGFLIAASYTSSVDDAIGLVPNGHHWRWLIDRRAYARSRIDGYRAAVSCSGLIEPTDCQVWAISPAIALSAAALRARWIMATRKQPLE